MLSILFKPKGRLNPKEYFKVYASCFLVITLLIIFSVYFDKKTMYVFTVSVMLLMVYIGIVIRIKRMRDIGMDVSAILIYILPIFNLILELFLFFARTDKYREKKTEIIEDYECDKCGAAVNKDDTVCPKCGNDVSDVIE